MTDLKGFSFTNIFLKVTFQIGVYLVHPFKVSKLLLHTHTTTAARLTEIAQLEIFIFLIQFLFLVKTCFSVWNSQGPSSSLMTPTTQSNHTARRFILKEKKRLQTSRMWAASHGECDSDHSRHQALLDRFLWSFPPVFRSWRTKSDQQVTETLQTVQVMSKNSWTADAETIPHWRNVTHTSETFIKCSRQDGITKTMKWTYGAQKLLSVCPQSLGYLEPVAFLSIKAPSIIFDKVENIL